jgi:hypothetical protein
MSERVVTRRLNRPGNADVVEDHNADKAPIPPGHFIPGRHTLYTNPKRVHRASAAHQVSLPTRHQLQTLTRFMTVVPSLRFAWIGTLAQPSANSAGPLAVVLSTALSKSSNMKSKRP